MRKTTMMTAGVLLTASLLTGCGSDGDGDSKSGGDDYCATMKKAAAEIKAFTADDANPDFSKFQDFIDKAEELADEAPSEIKDDWKVVLGAMDDLTSALDDAGISIEELMAAATTGEMPDGVDMQKLTELGSKLQTLTSDKTEAATDAIDKHAKDECDIDLSKS